MKKFKHLIIALAAIGSITACQKENLDSIQAETPGVDLSLDGRLVDATLLSSVPVTKAYDEAIASAEKKYTSWERLTGTDETPNLIAGVLDMLGESYDRASLPDLGMDLKIWRITYRSKGGYEGAEAVTLTADVAFVAPAKGHMRRTLESVSLFNPIFNCAEGDISGFRDIVIPMRAFHNALVVYPFYQGTFSDKGKHVVTPGDFYIKGWQALEAELAALELIDSISEEENVSMMDNYYTELMGVSNGGGTVLAAQYILEKVAPAANEKKIHLAGTYVGEGCCSYTEVFPLLMDKTECPDEYGADFANVEDLKPGAYMAPVVAAWMTWMVAPDDPDKDAKIAELKSRYFKEEFLNTPYQNALYPELTAANYVDALIEGKLVLGIYGDFTGMTIEDMVNENMVKDGSLDPDCEEMKELDEIFKASDTKLYADWKPENPIHFHHSTVDEFVPYSSFRKIYDALSDNGTNENISLTEDDTLGHAMSAMYCTIADIMLKKHPCPILPPKHFSK